MVTRTLVAAPIGAGGRGPDEPDPRQVLRVPADAEFGDDDFFVSTSLAARAAVLAERHEDLEHLHTSYTVVCLWKRAGGTSKGRPVFGKTVKPGGLLKLFSASTWAIWLAADHCRGAGYGDREIEALLFHELLHTGIAEVDDETGRGGGPTLRPHDAELFRAELEVYGLWDQQLRDVAPAFRQGTLFDTSPR